MTRKQELIRGAIALAVFVGALFLMSRCQGARFEARTKAIIDENDSLRTTLAVREALDRQSEERIATLVIEKEAAQDSARRAFSEANRLRVQRRVIAPVASQPGAAPTVSDTLHAVEKQLDNCEAETVALRATIQQDSVAAAKSAKTEAERAGQLAGKDSSIVALRGRLDKTERQLAAADPPCRVLFIACPTRKTVFVATAVTTAVVTIVLTRKP